MDRSPLNFGFSSCPTTPSRFTRWCTAWSRARVMPHIDDVEALNGRAERGEADVTKISIAAYSRIRDLYALLRSGGAAGFGVGPIVVARTARPVDGRIAIPGERTTAALLLNLLGRFETVPMRFDQIEPAVLRGDVDCGVLIHEGRFTYQAKGLTLLEDLGRVWETRMQCPLPLAAIAIRRDLVASTATNIDDALRASVDYAFAHPAASRNTSPSTPRKWTPRLWHNTSSSTSTTTPSPSTNARFSRCSTGPEQGLSSAVQSSAPVFV